MAIHVSFMRLIEDKTHFTKSTDSKLLCCLHSLLTEKLNFCYRLVKIKVVIFPPFQAHGPPKIYVDPK